MKKYFFIVAVVLSLAFLPKDSHNDCKELKAQIVAYQELGTIDDLRATKAEMWRLRSEIRDLKAKNTALLAENESLKTK